MTQFTHLSLHTEYSIVDGLIRLPELAQGVHARGMDSVAITDRRNLFALWKFQKEMRKNGVKPIFGADMTLSDQQDEFGRILLLAKNEKGLDNLRKLMTFAYTNKTSYSCITTESLVGHHEDLIVLSGGVHGQIGQVLLAQDLERAAEIAGKIKRIFGDRFYMEVTRTARENEDVYIPRAVGLADDLQIPLVATNDVCFLEQEQYNEHETRYCIANKKHLGDGSHDAIYSPDQYLRTPGEMAKLFHDLPDAVENAFEISRRCTVEVNAGQYLPMYKTELTETPKEILDAKAREQLKQKLERFKEMGRSEQDISKYLPRLEHELEVIKTMGFAGYFLIVMDFVQWAKTQGIPVGPGRGSGSASLVAFVLDITEIDPIEHDLMFERLLNPERVSLPDFDIDFCMDRRGEVIRYVSDLYGHRSVGQIVTFGTLAAKAVIRDVTRAHGKPYGLGESIVRLIPDRLHVTLTQAIQERPELNQLMQSNEDVREVVGRGLKLEGLVRNMGKHPGGIVITPEELDCIVPLFTEDPQGDLIAQFDKQDIEEIGVVKFDFLGLKTVTAIANACSSVADQNDDIEEKLHPSDFPLDDKSVFKMLQTANTVGVFQLESRGMRRTLKDLKPDSIEDLSALLALFRPGPIQSGVVERFVQRKHGREEVDYLHPLLERTLKKTYGMMVYQEDVMTVARDLAGFSMGEADGLRMAIGKKDVSVMKQLEEKFRSGCVAAGVEESVATSIYEDMFKFAQYAFNRAHSMGYAVVAYQTAYLKTKYPAEYLAALASCDLLSDRQKVREYVCEARRLGMELTGPTINESLFQFTGCERRIVVGFGALRNVPRILVDAILEARRERKFSSLYDVCNRANLGQKNVKSMEVLIQSGALDEVSGESSSRRARPKLMAQLNSVLESVEDRIVQESKPFDDIFGIDEEPENEPEVVEFCAKGELQALEEEKKVLGFYASGHPMKLFRRELKQFCTHSNVAKLPQSTAKNYKVAGVIQDVQGANRTVREIMLEDEHGVVEMGLFADANSDESNSFKEGQFVVVDCKVQRDDPSQNGRVRVRSIKSIEDFRSEHRAQIEIDFSVNGNGSSDRAFTELLEEISTHDQDGCPVVINYQLENYSAPIMLGEKWRVLPTVDLLARLESQFGEDSVRVSYPNK